jgi:hypothetical protein
MAALRELNTSLQGRTAKLRNQFDAASLGSYAWIVARLGAWSGYPSRGNRPPGPKTTHRMIIVEHSRRVVPGNSFHSCVAPVGGPSGEAGL